MYAVRISTPSRYKVSECANAGIKEIRMEDTKLFRRRKSVIILKGFTKCMT